MARPLPVPAALLRVSICRNASFSLSYLLPRHEKFLWHKLERFASTEANAVSRWTLTHSYIYLVVAVCIYGRVHALVKAATNND